MKTTLRVFHFLAHLAGFASLVAAFLATAAHAAGPAKNVIFFLGDGMGPAVVTSGRIYAHGEAGTLTMETFPHTARIKTFSRNAQTTDSAPSMSAYMTGVKMNNDVLSMSPDTVADLARCVPGNGQPVSTLLELAKAQGKAVGSVTTTEATHATPAATYSHICHRDLANDIAVQAVPGGAGYNAALGDGLNVLFGGGRNYWTPYDASTNPKGRKDGRDLTAELASHGYAVASDKAGFDKLPDTATRAVGFFSATSHLSYDLDRDPTLQPSLAEMTVKAIQILKRASPNGFFLMVEGGRIDHALHSTTAKKALGDLLAFDTAIQAALSQVDGAETLIVVTADHDHTLTLAGYGKRGQSVLEPVKDFRSGAPVVDADGFGYTPLLFGNGETRPDTRSAKDLLNFSEGTYHQVAGVRQTAGNETHGGGDVMLMATGAGSGTFKGTLDNTRVFQLVKQAAGY